MALEKQLLLTNHVIVQYAMVWLTPNNMHLLYMYYLANCGHSRSNGVGISRGNNKNWDGGVDATLQIRPILTRVTMPNLIAVVHTTLRVLIWSPPQNWVPRVLPFKVTQSHWNQHGSIR